MLAEGQILGDQVGPVGKQSADDGSDEPEQEHRHLISLIKRESVPEYTRSGSRVGIHTADEVFGRHNRASPRPYRARLDL